MPTIDCGSSLRTVPPETTLRRARQVAGALGISRVTDITRLDRVGVPVCASIRPGAMRGSLCVNAGKGLTLEDARVGAFMEAIEFAVAEPGRSHIRPRFVAPSAILDGPRREDAVLDFCPVMNAAVDLTHPIGAVEAQDLLSECSVLVPAELVFLPCPTEIALQHVFGSNSNGLASGNTADEATVHAICEVIERDIRSFQSVNDLSRLVVASTLPRHLSGILDAIDAAGLELHLRYFSNDYNVPYFMAVVFEPGVPDPIYVSGGYGCHLSRDIAATRAITEALQSRLSFIHGGRDDLIDRYHRFAGWSDDARQQYATRLVARCSDRTNAIDFTQVPCLRHAAPTVVDALTLLLSVLRDKGIRAVCRVSMTPADADLHVVRVLVPRLEFFNESTTRIGTRLRDYVAAL